MNYILVVVILFFALSHAIYIHNKNRRCDGEMVISKKDDGLLFGLELYEDPRSLEDRKYIRFKVINAIKEEDYAE